MAVEELGLEVAVEGFRAFMTKMTKMDKAIGGTGKKWTGLSGIAGTATKALGTLAKVGLTAVVAGAAAAAAAVGALAVGMVKLGVDSFKLATDFQSQMAVLGIAASSAGLSFDELHDVALQVGGDITLLGVSATGAADSMTGLYKAGLTTTEIFGDLQGYMAGTAELGGALRASIDLAAASELDMVQASDLAAIALATFGGELETEAERAEFVNDALNNMVQAADASVAEVSGLAAALTNVGPVAAQFGFSIEDTNNALAILSTRGIQGSEAGTALRSMFTNIMRPTSKVQGSLDDLNVSLYDSEGAMLSLPQIIGQFEGALSGLTEEQRNLHIQTLAGTYGMKAFNTLIGEGVTGWDAMADATANAMGIQEQAATRADTYAGKMEALEGTIETLKIGIGEAFLPVAQELATWFAEMVDEHGPALQSIFEAIGAFMTENLPSAIAFVTQTFNTLVSWWEENWPIIQAAVVDAWAMIEPILAQIGQWLETDGPAMLETLKVAWDEVWSLIQKSTDKVVKWFEENLPLIKEAGQTMLDFWNDHIVPALDNVWNIIKIIVSTAIDVVLKVITLVMQIITGDWESAWETIKEIANTIWIAIKEIVTEFIEGVLNTVDTTLEEFGQMWSDNWENFKEVLRLIWEAIVEAVTEKIQEVRDAVMDKIAETIEDVRGKISDFFTVGADLIIGLRDGVISKMKEVVQAVVDAIQKAIQAARDILGAESHSKVFAEIGRNTMEGFTKGVAELTPMVQAQIQAAVVPARAGAGSVTSTVNNYHNYNLTTNATTRPGGLRMEFDTMAMATR